MNKEIRKIKIDDETTVEIQYTEIIMVGEGDAERPVKNQHTAKLKFRAHRDLLAQLEALKPHVLQLCEITDSKKGLDGIPKNQLEPITVTGVSFGGEEDDYGVTIIARKKLKYNRGVNLITPFIKFDPDQSKYDYADELYQSCIELQRETELYMIDKHAPEPQLSMDLN